MQPYFLPYAGYFRLMCGVDAFVVLDNVQFPRRGWVHRSRLRRYDGKLAWLTLPLRYAVRSTPIRDMAFHPQVNLLWPERMRSFPACGRPTDRTEILLGAMNRIEGRPADYLTKLLQTTIQSLGLAAPPFVRESDWGAADVSGPAARIIGLCKALGATTYVNAPGGRDLYAAEEFATHGIRLEFLPAYRGAGSSILQRLHDEPIASVRHEIECNLV